MEVSDDLKESCKNLDSKKNLKVRVRLYSGETILSIGSVTRREKHEWWAFVPTGLHNLDKCPPNGAKLIIPGEDALLLKNFHCCQEFGSHYHFQIQE